MKKCLLIVVFLLGFSHVLLSQDTISVSKKALVGRWTEIKRMEGDNERIIKEYPDTYIFTHNMIFHKGEMAEGVIVFNVTGKYNIERNTITVYYVNYLEKEAGRRAPKKMQFIVLSISDNEMDVLVKDYDYEYRMLLRK
jgi:hypothetical protein